MFANHHGVDARQRTVQARSCQICSQYSQTITAWTRDTERCTNQNPELNENESDPDFLLMRHNCLSVDDGSHEEIVENDSKRGPLNVKEQKMEFEMFCFIIGKNWK